MHTTLRDYLTVLNVPLEVHSDASCSKARTDAASLNWPVVEGWSLWQDFNIDNINALFGPLLNTPFNLADPTPFLISSGMLRHEAQFDFVLTRQNNIIVNEALRVACDLLNLHQIEWIRGSNESGDRTFPDWSGTLVSNSAINYDTNLVPGDSKFTRDVLRPERGDTEGARDSDQVPLSSSPNRETSLAQSCLQQVNNEAYNRGV